MTSLKGLAPGKRNSAASLCLQRGPERNQPFFIIGRRGWGDRQCIKSDCLIAGDMGRTKLLNRSITKTLCYFTEAICPTSSPERLAEHHCKIIRRNCGCFLSCADFY